MEMMDLLNFDIQSNCISAINKDCYFFRIKPPNFTTLAEHEKTNLRTKFETFLRNIEDMHINLFSMDKTVNLDSNRQYANTFDERFDFIRDDILDSLNCIEIDNGNTERSYYFIIKPKSEHELVNFERILKVNGLEAYMANDEELISIMRCFLLREFIDQPIYLEERDGE